MDRRAAAATREAREPPQLSRAATAQPSAGNGYSWSVVCVKVLTSAAVKGREDEMAADSPGIQATISTDVNAGKQ